MDTKSRVQEQISALADGELNAAQVDAILANLQEREARADWDLYHRIGDVLRSSDMAVDISPGFSARMAAALEKEPTILAPATAAAAVSGARHDAARSHRWAIPGMAAAAAAVATIAFVATPQLMVAMKAQPTPRAEALVNAASADATTAAPAVLVSAPTASGVVLRDERMDDYLLAHQRFSPSLYSTAQYARSATFANDATK